MITLKEFKQKIKLIGQYKFKSYSYGGNLRFLEVLDQDKNFIVGAGSNVYIDETIKKHKVLFDLLNKYRNLVFDNLNNQKVIF